MKVNIFNKYIYTMQVRIYLLLYNLVFVITCIPQSIRLTSPSAEGIKQKSILMLQLMCSLTHAL